MAEPDIFIASEEGIQNAIDVLSWGNTREGHKFGTHPSEGQDFAPRGGHSQDQAYPPHVGGQGAKDYMSQSGGQDYAPHFGGQDRFSSRRQAHAGGHKKSGSGVGGEEDLPARGEGVVSREGRKLHSPSMGLDGSEPFGDEPLQQVPRPTKQGAKLSVSSDSGISLPQPNVWASQLYEFPSADVKDDGGKDSQELSANILSKGMGPFYLYSDTLEGSHDYLHDSDSDHSGQVF